MGAIGSGLGRLGEPMGSVECYGVGTGGIGIPNGNSWVLWGQDWEDWGDWDGQ